MKKLRSIALLLSAFALAACEKNAVQDITGTLPGAQIRFFNFGVNAPGVNFFANDVKAAAVSPVSGAESATGVAYGGVGSAGFYGSVKPGATTLTGRIAAVADNNLVISTTNSTLEDGKFYSLYLSGFYDATGKKSDAFIIEDNFPQAYDYTVAYVRFVNAIANSQPMTLFARNTTTTTETQIGAAVAYKAGGAFVAVPPGIYDLSTRLVGSTTNAIARTAVTFSPGKTYTISGRGDMTVTSTTAATRPFLDNTANR